MLCKYLIAPNVEVTVNYEYVPSEPEIGLEHDDIGLVSVTIGEDIAEEDEADYDILPTLSDETIESIKVLCYSELKD